MKAQSAAEYMMIFGFSLVLLSILWAYSSQNIDDARWDLESSYAKAALNRIAETAEIAYVQGPPSEFYIYPTFPDNIQNAYVSGTTLTLELRWKGVLRNITAETTADVTGSLPTAPGAQRVHVLAENGSVAIS